MGTKNSHLEVLDVPRLDMDYWVETLTNIVNEELAKTSVQDGSHDLGHLYRVSSMARKFTRSEQGDELVALAAGMLHDIVNLPKNDPNANKSSLYAAARAEELLLDLEFPKGLIPNVCHSIHAHSFSARVTPKTIEAMCLQDADRMEALGAFGLMRVFYCAGMFGSQILDENDPAGIHREYNDKKFALDHFVQKLLKLYDTMKTETGRTKALSLSIFLADYRNGLIADHSAGHYSTGRFKIARIYQEAGQKRIGLFHSDDPFADGNRSLDTTRYALDALLTEEDPNIQFFLQQLRFELNGYQA